MVPVVPADLKNYLNIVLIGKVLSTKQQNIAFRHNWYLRYCRESLMFFRYLPLFILCTFLDAQEDTRPTVAILDFEGQDISIQEVQTLTERMRTEIGNTNAVRLIERKAIESIMAEQGLAQSGCVTDECAAQVGQLLGVQFIINGSIGKIGDSFTIDVKMFSVETGTTERSSNVTHEGDIEGLLVEMQILAWNIVGLEAPTTAAPTTALPTSEAPTTQAISETLTLTDHPGNHRNCRPNRLCY